MFEYRKGKKEEQGFPCHKGEDKTPEKYILQK
jgi:hypothetical protein